VISDAQMDEGLDNFKLFTKPSNATIYAGPGATKLHAWLGYLFLNR